MKFAMNAKAQQSLEFILTYGWAIVLISIAAGIVFFLSFRAGEITFSSDSPAIAIEESFSAEGIVSLKARNVSGNPLKITSFSLGKDLSDFGDSTLNGMPRKSLLNNPAIIQPGSEILFENIAYSGLGIATGEIIIKATSIQGEQEIKLSATGSTYPNAIPLTSCTNLIDRPGSYALANDISSKTGCLKIEADNVFLNCQGKTIDGHGTGNGISLNGRKNITIANCPVNNFSKGILAENSTSLNINNSSAFQNREIGFNLVHTSDSSLFHNLSRENAKGFYLLGSQRNSIWENTSDSNDYGFVLYGASNSNALESNNSLGNAKSGLLLFNSRNNKIVENTFCGNTSESGKDIECLGSSENNLGSGNKAGQVSKYCALESILPC